MDSDSDAILREPPMADNERDTLLGALDRQRRYVAWKCGNTVDWDADLIRESVDGLVGEDPE